MLPDGLFSFLAMPNTKRKKRRTDDGVQIIWYTILVGCVRPVYFGLCLQAVVSRTPLSARVGPTAPQARLRTTYRRGYGAPDRRGSLLRAAAVQKTALWTRWTQD
jgi:hypothetical protein